MDERMEPNKTAAEADKLAAGEEAKAYHPGFPAEADVSINPSPATAVSPEDLSGQGEAAAANQAAEEGAEWVETEAASAGAQGPGQAHEAGEEARDFVDEFKDDLRKGFEKVREEVADFARGRSEGHDPEQGWGKQARRDVDEWLDQAGKDLKEASADVKEWAQKTHREFKEAVNDAPENPNEPNIFREVGRTVKDIGENLKDFFEGDKPADKK